jgi:hypothetical protein
MRVVCSLDRAKVARAIGSEPPSSTQIITGTVCTILGSQQRWLALGSFSAGRRTGGLAAEEVTDGDSDPARAGHGALYQSGRTALIGLGSRTEEPLPGVRLAVGSKFGSNSGSRPGSGSGDRPSAA